MRLDRLGRRPDEDQAGVAAGPGEVGVLGEEAVARMDRLRAGRGAPPPGSRRRADSFRSRAPGRSGPPRRPAPRAARRVGVGIDRDRADAEALQRADDAAGDLAAIGDQDRVEHERQLSQAGARLSRNAPMPSRPSGVALSAAIRCAVPSISGASIGRPPRSRISALGRRDRGRPALQEVGQDALDRGIELLGAAPPRARARSAPPRPR